MTSAIPSVYCLCIATEHSRCHRPTLLFVVLFLLCMWTSATNGRMVRSRKGPEYLERKFQGTNVPGNKCSAEGKVCRVYSFSGMNGPGNKWSRERKLHHGNECSRERIVLRTNVPAFTRTTTSNATCINVVIGSAAAVLPFVSNSRILSSGTSVNFSAAITAVNTYSTMERHLTLINVP